MNENRDEVEVIPEMEYEDEYPFDEEGEESDDYTKEDLEWLVSETMVIIIIL